MIPFSLNHSELVWPKKVPFGWRTLLKHHDGRFWLFKNFELLGLRVESGSPMSQRPHRGGTWQRCMGSKICTCWGWRIKDYRSQGKRLHHGFGGSNSYERLADSNLNCRIDREDARDQACEGQSGAPERSEWTG